MQNPLLYDKKKFHFRVHLLLSNINKKTNYHFFDTLRIITAPENYKNSDYTNSRIHDSHIKFSDDIILNSKKQLDKLNITEKDFINIKKQINLIIKTVYKIAKPYIKPYETIENAFELLGCDFMVDSNLNVYLLEVNDHISYKFHDPTRRDVINFRKRLTNFIYNKTVKKLI
jgi:hypothetical protein